MSNLSFTQVSLTQQETITGGSLKGIPTANKFNVTVNPQINVNTNINTNIGIGINIGKNNTINIGQYIQNKA